MWMVTTLSSQSPGSALREMSYTQPTGKKTFHLLPAACRAPGSADFLHRICSAFRICVAAEASGHLARPSSGGGTEKPW